MSILDFVKNTPLPKLTSNEQKGFCPFCSSHNLLVKHGETTLLGYFGYWDLNHRTYSITCEDCGKEFVRHIKGNNEWYVTNGNIIAGLPSCYEQFVYSCKHCENGKLHREYLNIDGTPNKSGILVFSSTGKLYKTKFTCDSCGFSQIDDEEYWHGYSLEDERDPIKHAVADGADGRFIITEEIGISVSNTKGLEKLKI